MELYFVTKLSLRKKYDNTIILPRHKEIIMLTMINGTSNNLRELRSYDGESSQIKSPYYQRLVLYSRQLIRTMNSPRATDDTITYCYTQLFVTRSEMDAIREKYYLITTITSDGCYTREILDNNHDDTKK